MLILMDEEVREEISSALANIQQPVQGRLRCGICRLMFGTVPIYLLTGNLVKEGQGTIFFIFELGCWYGLGAAREKIFRSLYFKKSNMFQTVCDIIYLS